MISGLSVWIRATALPAALGLLAGCHADPRAGQYVGDDITNTDFEDQAGWGADVNALTREHAHSGRFATFVGPDREFSLTYQLPLGQASVHPLRAVDLEAWVYLPTAGATAALTVQVFRPPGSSAGPPLYYEALQLTSQVVPVGKWSPVHHVFVLPAGLPAEASLRIYMWRTSSAAVYLDDLHAKARE